MLFIDARELGSMVDRTHRELTAADITRIADTYHRWRSEGDGYKDELGSAGALHLKKSASMTMC